MKTDKVNSCSLTEAFVNLFFPLFCIICGEPLEPGNKIFLCSACLGKVKRIREPVCEKCGKPGSRSLCEECRKTKQYYTIARAAGIYDGILRECIHKLKYGGELFLAKTLANFMVDALKQFPELAQCNLIVPVPLHRVRERERGCNQAYLLARGISNVFKVGISGGNLRRVRRTSPQTDLPRSLRLSNVRGIFGVRDSSEFNGQELLLIDDVYTTGSTVNECSKTLIEAGAKSVCVLTAARGE